MKKYSYLIILFLLTLIFCKSQRLSTKDQYLLFFDVQSGKTKIIVNDSLVYKGRSDKPVLLKKSDYPENLNSYNYHLQANNKNYFIHDGGGVVLEYSKDSLKRIDRSFLHRNQFHASSFVHNNNLYLFGGYGLFTDKNIITQYNFKSNEWFEVSSESELMPNVGSNYTSIIIGNDFYIFGGEHKITKGVDSRYITPNELWKFNLKTRKWKKLGEVNLGFIKDKPIIFNVNALSVKEKIYFFDKDYPSIIDIKENKIYFFKAPLPILPSKMVYNSKTETIDYLSHNDAENSIVFKSIEINEFFKTPFEQETFYKDKNLLKDIFFIFIVVVLLFFFLKRKIFIKYNNENKLLYNSLEDQWYYKKEVINDFETIERAILKYLVLNNKRFIPINNLNSIIEDEIKTDNLNAVLRKRENMLHQIKYKISIIVNSEYSEIIIEQKNLADKRIKEIKLNSEYIDTLK